ncbi:pectinesterase family protein [Chitinophaga sedimenti]|uniref:pectinesterase family protein n=1 Tax=Chitinophaga sedimenti TaxID=2033606 RepID=UPI0020067CD8|nr:pectinesterase family protein [Chitinophaga sedimenti]MCK7555582.1 pectinesterase family protein [Chitinophaga sedimenti]
MRKSILFLFSFMLMLAAQAQQTSTDTAWKQKLRLSGQTNIPPYPASLTVAQDGSGDYVTIQEAVNAVRDLSQVQVVIHIRPGVYKEKLIIPTWKKKVKLLGRRMHRPSSPTRTIRGRKTRAGVMRWDA